MLKPFTTLDAIAAPLMRDNIDTDMIVRVERLVALRRGEFGPYLLETLRFDGEGSENPDFILNRAPYREAKILVTGANFGCGSSRESAVWSLADFGIRCIIAPSYGEIFRNNCIQNGLLPIALESSEVARIAAAVAPGANDPRLRVDLESEAVRLPDGGTIAFSLDQRGREMLLKGEDAVAMTLHDGAAIDDFQRRDRLNRPWIYKI